jgi:hypothetical protein
VTYLVLHVRPYDFEADDGRRLSGASVTYVDLEAPAPLASDTSPERGLAPLTITAPARITNDFSSVPGLYDLHFHHRRGKGGKPTLALGAAQLVRAVDLATL